MTINILDVSNYQQYNSGVIDAAHLNPIDWVTLKKDPRQFRAVWCKCAEGIGPNYNPLDYERQARGAIAAGLGAGPYHYWHYGLGSREQAATFWNAAKGFSGNLPPMVDIEDIEAFKLIDNAPNASYAQANCKDLFANVIWLYVTEVERLFGKKPLIYTGGWWWSRFSNRLLAAQSSSNPDPWPENADAVFKYKNHMCYSACYDQRFLQPQTTDYLKALHVTGPKEALWQYTSTPKPPIPGVGVKGINGVPGEAVDCGQWLLADDAFWTWSGLPKPPVEPPPSDDLQAQLDAQAARIETLEARMVKVDNLFTDLDDVLAKYLES